jgi:hypothetical protein
MQYAFPHLNSQRHKIESFIRYALPEHSGQISYFTQTRRSYAHGRLGAAGSARTGENLQGGESDATAMSTAVRTGRWLVHPTPRACTLYRWFGGKHGFGAQGFRG